MVIQFARELVDRYVKTGILQTVLVIPAVQSDVVVLAVNPLSVR